MARPPAPDPPHGSTRRYRLRRDPCACRLCRRAWADYIAAYRAHRSGRAHQLRLDPALRLDAHVTVSDEPTMVP